LRGDAVEFIDRNRCSGDHSKLKCGELREGYALEIELYISVFAYFAIISGLFLWYVHKVSTPRTLTTLTQITPFAREAAFGRRELRIFRWTCEMAEAERCHASSSFEEECVLHFSDQEIKVLLFNYHETITFWPL